MYLISLMLIELWSGDVFINGDNCYFEVIMHIAID